MPSAPPRGRNLPAPRSIPPVLDPAAAPIPEDHQLPPHQSKVERITEHVAALSEDLREYVEIRVALVQRKVEGIQGTLERVSLYVDQADMFVPAIVLGLVGVLFLLVTLALGLGALVGSYWLGFFIVTALLLTSAGLFAWVGMRRVNEVKAIQAKIKEQQHGSRDATREQIQSAEAKSARQSAV